MNDIILSEKNLPANIGDLAKFVLVGREKLVAVRAEIRAIDKVGLAEDVRRQKLEEAQAISEAVLDAEVRIGELMAQIPKATPNNNPFHEKGSGEQFVKTKSEIIKQAGFTEMQAKRFQTLAAHPEIVEQAKAEARENDDVVSRTLALNMIKTKQKEEQLEKAKQQITAQNKPTNKPVIHIGDGVGYVPTEKYDLLLTDPPYSTDVENINEFVEKWLYTALDNVKDTGFAYIFIGAYPDEMRAYLNAEAPSHMRWCQPLIWTYKNTLGNNPKDRYKLNYQMCLFYRGVNAPNLDCPLTAEQWAVQEINAPDGRLGDRYHAWQKPLEIAERFVRHSTKQGQTVFDPFACTGTFLIAAAKLGRKAYGFEINADNAKIAEERGCALE